jgi:hypothetical protein
MSDRTVIRDAVAGLAAPGTIVEVRALTDRYTHSGYFADHDALAKSVEVLDTDSSVLGLYVTLNEINPALLSRRANRIKMRLGKKDATTGDADIIRRRWLPVDIDPVRPSGVSSTDEEHALAIAKAEEIASYLSALGYPEPVKGDSGNGAHLLYRIDLKNDDAATALVKSCLAALDVLFSDTLVSVDTANFNAARIWKLYGTVSRKGDNTPDRPHRRSRILSSPEETIVVTEELLNDLAARLPDEHQAQKQVTKGKLGGNDFDLRTWLSDHGPGVRSEKPYHGGTLFVLEECPFSSAHKDGAFAIQFSNGAVFAGCKHTSCGGGTQRWQELRDRFEPDRTTKQKMYEQAKNVWKKERAVAKATREGSSDPPDPVKKPGSSPPPDPSPPKDPDDRDRALEVLTTGDPVALMLEAFAREHVGDEILARCMIFSMASQSIKNSDGLHVSVTGDSGKGKSHAFKKMLRQVPDRYKIKGTMSNKALYYRTDILPRTVFMSDDTELSDNLQEILKSTTSNFHEPVTHTTVTKDLTSKTCTIPGECVWWIAKKEGTGDDQVQNRMLTCWIDESKEQDERVLAAKRKKECREPDSFIEESDELLTSRGIWEYLHEQKFWVVIPFSERIRFHTIRNRRNPDMLFDLVKSHAALYSMQRKTKILDDGTTCVYAEEADFLAANDVFTLLNGTSGGQESKLTRRESDLLEKIVLADLAEFTIQDLQQWTEDSYMGIYRLIKGYESRGKNYTGLLEKCPALSFTDRTITTTNNDGNTVRRRTEAFAWDRELYRQWKNGGSCWLDRDPGNDDDHVSGSFTALQHGYSSFTARAVNKNEEPGAAGSGNKDDYQNNSVLLRDGLQQNRKYGADRVSGNISGKDADLCLHNSPSAVNEKRSLQKGPQISDPVPQYAPVIYSSCCKTAEMSLDPAPAAVNEGPPRTIRAKDYKKLDVPEIKTACFACGKKGSWFVEKLTKERRARPEEERGARRICRSCYAAAVKAEQEACVPLPGTIDISRMERVMVEVGKCSVCKTKPAEYIDRENSVRLCGHCYGREVRGT